MRSCALLGINGHIVEVECDVSTGLPGFEVVGLPDASIREARERVKSAIKNCGFEFNSRRITTNLAPASIKKEGAAFDLPIAVSILIADTQISVQDVDNYLMMGELSLSGELRSATGILAACLAAKAAGIKNIIVPYDNATEAALVQGLNVYGAKNLYDVTAHLSGRQRIEPTVSNVFDEFTVKQEQFDVCFSEVRGQQNVKRSLEVAAAGGHNCLIIGTPGSGKSMLAKRIPTILPTLNFDEALEVTKIHSIAGILDNEHPLVAVRPFRSPHHSISNVGLVGGGSIPHPGEMSLAHKGVLFLDELPEFKRDVMEVMRQPLEDGKVTIARVSATLTYPCDVMLVAAMNPCRCGYFSDPKRKCRCKTGDITRYLNKISGPLLDRFDIQIEAQSVLYDELNSRRKPESSMSIRERVIKARQLQNRRYINEEFSCNAQLNGNAIEKYCVRTPEAERMMSEAFSRMNLSARGYSRVLKVARTIADLGNRALIELDDICEAICYRSLDKKFWG